jgi:ketosteroid isomerase-like protein
MDKKDAMLLQNARFYDAFEHGDLEALADIWAHGQHVKCIHPGWSLLVGWSDVKQSWQNIFASGVSMKFSLREISAEVYGTIGVVVLMEEITYNDGPMTHTGAVLATNLFEFAEGRWRMILHHGSPLLSNEEEDYGTYKYN